MPTDPTNGDDPRSSLDSESNADVATLALPARDSAAHEPDTTNMAKKIGRHVVLEQVGRGGMGSVYRAYDPKLQREVALKKLRTKALGVEGPARFEQEARAMAALSHPNVVGVYDVELLDDGQLVLVMEYVAGPTLRSWVRQKPRPWQELLLPFLGAGRGLAAAHRAGLLHRDFKPANVLVTPDLAKVTDFGLAKRAKDLTGTGGLSSSNNNQRWDETDEEDLTRAGEVMGTPRYMAPEQHHGRELTPAVDQFAFCVALWEALTQTAPFTGEDLARKKSKGPPEWPTNAGPRWLGDALRRGLQPKPEARWPDMDALLDALSRDPGRRRTQLIRAGAVVALVGVAGAAAYAAGADGPGPCSGADLLLEAEWGDQVRADVRVGMTSVDVVYAQSLWQRVDQRLDDYAQEWIGSRRSACEATVRKEHSDALRDLRVGCLDRGRIAFRAIVDLLQDADVDVLRNVDTMIDELPDLARCGDLAALQEGTNPPAADEAEAVAALRDNLEMAKVDRLAAHYDAAETKLDHAQLALEALDYAPVRGEFELERAKLLFAQGHQQEAADAYRMAMRLAVETRDWDRFADAAADLIRTVGQNLEQPQQVLILGDVAESAAKGNPLREAQVSIALGVALAEDGQHDAGEQRVRDAIEVLSETVGAGDQRVAAARNNLGAILRSRGKLAEAEAEYRTAIDLLIDSLGPDHPKIAIVRGNLASILRERGRIDDAETEARKADAARLRSLGPTHVLYGSGKTTLANVLTDARKFDDAEAEAKKGLEVIEAAVGRVHGKTADAVNALGRILIMQGKALEAEEAFRDVLAIRTELNGPEHPAIGGAYLNIAVTLRRQNRLEDAEQMYRDAERVWTKAYGVKHPNVAAVHNNLGVLYLDMERYEDARRESQRALEIKREFLQPGDPAYLETRNNLAEAYAGLGELQSAEAEHRAILEALEPTKDADDPRLALTRSRLAKVLLKRGQSTEALELAERALREVRKNGLNAAEQGNLVMTLCKATYASDRGPKGLAKARALAQQALQLFVQAGLDGEVDAQETRDWLADHPG